MTNLFNRLIFFGSIVFVCLVPRIANACHETTVCVSYAVGADDIGVGDFPASEDGVAYLPGRGVRVTLIPPPPEIAFDTLTDDVGCFTFSTDFEWGHKLLVHNEAYLGDEKNIRMVAYPGYAEYVAARDQIADEPLAPWLVDLQWMAEGAHAYASVPIPPDLGNEVDDNMRFFAWANYILGKLEDELDPGLEGELHLRLVAQEPVAAQLEGNAFADLGGFGGMDFIYLWPENTAKKFTIAHEIGHWLAKNWGVNITGSGFDHVAMDDPCAFRAFGSNSLHGLRSAEDTEGALSEGWGHFVAAWVFDDPESFDARFKYYKTPDPNYLPSEEYDDLIADDYEVSLVGGNCSAFYSGFPESCPESEHVFGGESAWVEFQCPTDWNWGEISRAWQIDASGPSAVEITPAALNDGLADVVLFPTVDDEGDWVAIGSFDLFELIYFVQGGGTPGVGGTVVWEYLDDDGTTWVALPNVSDATSGFTSSAPIQGLAFSDPSDYLSVPPDLWTREVLPVAGGTAYYYIRARVTQEYTTNPTYDRIIGGDASEVSSEMDWMRFFWQMTSDDVDEMRYDPAPQPAATLSDLLELLRLAEGNGPGVMWFELEAAILNEANTNLTDFEGRFYELTEANGVNNGKGL